MPDDTWYAQEYEEDPDEVDDNCPRCSGKGCAACDPCFKCGKRIRKGRASLAMNLPGVTPGPVYFCHVCEPLSTPEEVQQRLEDFMNPKVER